MDLKNEKPLSQDAATLLAVVPPVVLRQWLDAVKAKKAAGDK